MGIKYQNFLRNNFFLLVLSSAVIVIVFLSYNRFIVHQDYIVGYEGKCDPLLENCFVGCEDDECTEEYYYSYVQKYAADLYDECGKDITDCEASNLCLPNDHECSITYCDPEMDGVGACETLTEEMDLGASGQDESFKTEEPLEEIDTTNTNI